MGIIKYPRGKGKEGESRQAAKEQKVRKIVRHQKNM